MPEMKVSDIFKDLPDLNYEDFNYNLTLINCLTFNIEYMKGWIGNR